ncbi:MAG: asparagine synthase (glutamine-hydrolyzing) [Candidatus Pacebacteria bacterium]|nr:asparagine synthase (glutamine-hydrolyzing) [Candidatus Paceibacterota bacterium]
MCGITGWFNTSRNRPKSVIQEMRDSLAHRGPNFRDQVLFKGNVKSDEGNVALGHTRLSVLDLSTSANQPMSDPTENYWIVYNGEIYNFHEIRNRLISEFAIQFKSNSDTEVLLHAYIRYGKNCLSLLNGMFAFAIYDVRKNDLFLARDRLGVKPLYYYHKTGEFVFASELKAIYKYLNGAIGINGNVIIEYFISGYIGGKQTIAQNTYRVPPATWLHVDPQNNITSGKFWELDINNIHEQENVRKYDENEIAISAEAALRESVKKRLVSDVPLGTLLSGGIDSTLITLLASQENTSQTHSFTIGFKDAQFDESGYARDIVKCIGTVHHEKIIDENDFLSTIPLLNETFDEPYADSSAIPTLILSRFVKDKITVALSGDGGDEQYFGYSTYKHLLFINRLYAMPTFIRSLFKLPLAGIAGFDFALKSRALGYKTFDLCRANLTNPFPVLQNLLKSSSNKLIASQNQFENLLPQNSLMLADLNNYLVDDVLNKVDKASMRFGLEVRTPFLDYSVVEQSFYKIPLQLKTDPPAKYILKKILSKYVPAHLYERPKKGFGVPIQRWVNGALYSKIEDLLHEKSILEEYFNYPVLLRLFKQKNMVNSKYGAILFWYVFCFLQWELRYLKGIASK